MLRVGDTARRSRAVTARDIELFTKLRTTITNGDGVTVLDGTALVWAEPV